MTRHNATRIRSMRTVRMEIRLQRLCDRALRRMGLVRLSMVPDVTISHHHPLTWTKERPQHGPYTLDEFHAMRQIAPAGSITVEIARRGRKYEGELRQIQSERISQ